MILKELIEKLEKYPKDKVVRMGFDSPHSYRGSYDELAFEPCPNTTVGQMLEYAKSAIGQTYEGYKGGQYLMDEYTTVNIAEYGSCGEEIGEVLLKYILEDF